MTTRCVCGCNQRAVHNHHALYAQELVRRAETPEQARQWVSDPRGQVPMAFRCHERHHNRHAPLPLNRLPDSVFEFAAEVMGPAAYDYLQRRYAGPDTRLDALLSCGSGRNTRQTRVNAPEARSAA